LRELSKKPDLLLKKDGDYVEQVNDFARVIAEVAKRSPLADQTTFAFRLHTKLLKRTDLLKTLGGRSTKEPLLFCKAAGKLKKVIP